MSYYAVPHLVERCEATYRATLDLRSVNAATIRETWPTPGLKAELSDFEGSVCFATIDFRKLYLQAALDPAEYDACGMTVQQGILRFTRVLYGLKNAATKFQSPVAKCSSAMQDAFKSWIDVFIIWAQCTEELLKRHRKFVSICTGHSLKVFTKR